MMTINVEVNKSWRVLCDLYKPCLSHWFKKDLSLQLFLMFRSTQAAQASKVSKYTLCLCFYCVSLE